MKSGIDFGLTLTKSIRISILSILLVLAGRTLNASGQTLTTLYQFGGIATDGHGPFAGLVQGSDGNFYGTTTYGGTNGDYGTVFKITSQGTLTTLWQFGANATNGWDPNFSGLVQGLDGNFYGTTLEGGTNGDYGTVFKITSQGTLTTLWQFNGTNGSGPSARLVQGSDGYFYGTTSEGGLANANQFGGSGYGTVFKITSQGTLTTLHRFGALPTDGLYPEALVQGSDGNFYGTTYEGGTNNCEYGCGTVFKITSQGTLTTLHQFGGYSTDGGWPRAGLVQGSDGDFYGTTQVGTVFEISSQGTLRTLYQFGGLPTDGSYPYASLLQGSDSNFYGTTLEGGTNNEGTVFKITPQGILTTLWQFNGTNGAAPSASLVQGSDGSFYGTTQIGGANNAGTVFKMMVPLNPLANQISGIHSAATNIVFTIPSVAYETYQLQFSSSMTPTNWINVPGASVTNCIGALLTLTNFGGALQPQGFYRFDITP